MLTEPIAVTLLVVDALEDLSVPYFIGGFLATAVHGVARATMDVDIVADLRVEHTAPLVDALGNAFYADMAMIRGAILRQGSFNLVHLKAMFKVDVFVRSRQPFDQTQFRRRQVVDHRRPLSYRLVRSARPFTRRCVAGRRRCRLAAHQRSAEPGQAAGHSGTIDGGTYDS